MTVRRGAGGAAFLCVLVLMPLRRAAAAGLNYFPGTGHCYEVINPDRDVKWSNAYGASRGRAYAMGVNAYLATVGSLDENQFIGGLLDPQRDYWIGARQTSGAAEPAGGWRWASGEPWTFANWEMGSPDNLAFQT